VKRNNAETFNGNRYSNKISRDQFHRVDSLLTDSVSLARVTIMNDLVAKAGNAVVSCERIYAADARITAILSFNVLDGSAEDFGRGGQRALIAESQAEKLFGSIQVSGKDVWIISPNDDSVAVTVAAVFKDFPSNSHESLGFFISFHDESVRSLGFNHEETALYGRTHALSIGALEQRLKTNDDRFSYTLQPLTEIYFGTRVVGEESVHGDEYSVLILTCVTALLLVLALSNYVILTTLSLPYRAKELAIKKLAGTSHWHLVRNFLGESLLIVSVSFVVGLVLLIATAEFTRPLLEIDVRQLVIGWNAKFVLICISTVVVITLAPLLLMPKFVGASPTGLLGSARISFPRIKRVLTIVQLGVSMLVLVFSMVMKRQINYSLVKEPGRNHDQIVYLDFPADLTQEGLGRLREGWRSFHPNIIDVLATSHLPHSITSKEINSPFYTVSVDRMFTTFFDLNMVRGNWFGPNSTRNSIIVNERGSREVGEPQSVLGVVDDISAQFNQPQKPLKFQIADTKEYNYLFIRILEVDIRRTVNFLSETFGHTKIHFLNPRFERWLQYQGRLNRVSNLLAIIGTVLSCLAIYGLSLSLVQEKTKQLAVHKIYGANVINITLMLAKHFGKEVLVAVALFGPVAYMLVTELLRHFAYATSFRWYDAVIPVAFSVGMVVGLSLVQSLGLNMRSLVLALKR
ncbi:MAG TPA: FtsX-like permease family protein, partial [Chryseosolibacter sp.]